MSRTAHGMFEHRTFYYALRIFSALVCAFLVLPIIVVLPLSLNAEPYFTFPIKHYSLQWYEQLFTSESWRRATNNSLIVASSTAVLATVLGTLAAMGLYSLRARSRSILTALLISPVIVPVIVTAVGIYFFMSGLGIANSLPALILAHTVLASPFVVIMVSSALASLDTNLPKAAAGLGAGPLRVFFRITAPLMLPGLLAGAIFAFVASFDDAIISTFLTGPEQHTLPREMWTGIRQQINPVILCATSLFVFISIIVLSVMELIRRHTTRLRGVKP